VKVPRAAFAFCRYTVMVLLWAAFLLRFRELVPAVVVILALSALLGIRRAPLVALYTHTVHRLWPSAEEQVDRCGLRFAHILGTLLGVVCVALLYAVGGRVGWGAVFVFAVLKTISAAGLCPASKLYSCMAGGQCCAFLKGR